jgi:HD-GYP domain-containing protein (c-di-GMP phosphodiesterase class II)
VAAPDLERKVQKLSAILEVAKGFSTQHTLDGLLDLILKEATGVVEADRCSIFLVDRERQELWTRAAQGTTEIRVALGAGIAGAVAKTGEPMIIDDAYNDDRFNRAVDQATGYRTRNILTVPMRDAAGLTSGVLQALNRKGGPFTSEDTEYLLALGGQAAVAVENASLHEEIQRLFESFVKASVVAIESRDPTTAGHSERVANLTVALADVVDRESRGSFAEVHFRAEQLREMRYAAILHDFGKVGVREHILVKANKLFPYELDLLQARFDFVRRSAELESWKRRADLLSREGPQQAARIAVDEEARLAAAMRDLEELYEFILQCNRPTVLAEGSFERITEIGKRTYTDLKGETHPLLGAAEVAALSIRRGSLSEEERHEIESHVTHTFRFLSQIPWTRTLRRVPEIAYAHHEKLNGRGYPRALESQLIPIESRIMTISDIYDALTASDRPYKKAVPHQKALDIIRTEAESGQLDKELFQLFVEGDVPKRAVSLG